MSFYNKLTKKTSGLKTAITNGLLGHPENFQILNNNIFINRSTGREIKKKTAEKLIRDSIAINQILYNKDTLLYNFNTGRFIDNTKANEKKINKGIKDIKHLEKDITKNPMITENPYYKIDLYERKIISDSPFQPIKLITNSREDIDFLYKNFNEMYRYTSLNKDKNVKIALTIYGGKENGKSIQSKFSSYNDSLENLINKVKNITDSYDTVVIECKKLIIKYLTVLVDYGNSSNDYNELGTSKYRVISPKSITNCLYQSYLLCENTKLTYYVNNQEALVQSARKLKQRLNPTLKSISTFETVQELSDYKKRKITILDNVYNIKKEFIPKNDNGKESIILKLHDNHFMACITWDSIKHLEDFGVREIKNNLIDESVIIRKFNKDEEFDNKIITWDIEATPDENNNFKAYAVGIAYNDIYKSWFGLDCLTKFLDYINDNFEIFNGWTFYAHNGGKFDIPLLLKEALIDYEKFTIDTKQIVELNKSFIGFGLRKGDFTIKMKDSLRLLPDKLEKLTKEFNVEHKKLVELVKHDQINLNNYMDYYNEISLYLRNDCLGLLEVLNIFSKSVYDDLKINITSCYTGASLSKKNYFKNYYDHFKTPIYTLTKDIDEFIREGYGGGRCEAFIIGTNIKSKSYYIDFTSLYPDQGRRCLPYGLPYKSQRDKQMIDLNFILDFYGFLNVNVRTKNFNKKPIHGTKDKNGRYIFAHFKNWTLLKGLFSEEIKLGLQHDIYEYEFIEGYMFDSKPFLKKFFTDAFNKKSEAKKAGNAGLSQCYKIIANSGYGFWGLRTEGRDGIKAFYDDKSAIVPIIQQNKLIDTIDHGKYTFIRHYNDLNVKDFNVSIASAISSYSRIKLWTAINDIEEAGGIVYYCDTDSIITNLSLKDHDHLMAKYMPDGTGEGLGYFKNECEDDIKKIKDKKLFDDQLEHDNGFFYYDELIINGCKFYSLKKTLINGSVIENTALKGYKQDEENILNFDIFEKLINKEILEIKQDQVQFINPKSNYVNEKKFNIQVKKIPKKFTIQYSKGVIGEMGIIKPHII
jgi:hypothetical protein